MEAQPQIFQAIWSIIIAISTTIYTIATLLRFNRLAKIANPENVEEKAIKLIEIYTSLKEDAHKIIDDLVTLKNDFTAVFKKTTSISGEKALVQMTQSIITPISSPLTFQKPIYEPLKYKEPRIRQSMSNITLLSTPDTVMSRSPSVRSQISSSSIFLNRAAGNNWNVANRVRLMNLKNEM